MSETNKDEVDENRKEIESRFKEIVTDQHSSPKSNLTLLMFIALFVVILVAIVAYMAYQKRDKWFPKKQKKNKDGGKSGSKIIISPNE